jgi:hypothetical protein
MQNIVYFRNVQITMAENVGIAGRGRFDITLLAKDFKAIDTTKARVCLYEGGSRVLGAFSSPDGSRWPMSGSPPLVLAQPRRGRG